MRFASEFIALASISLILLGCGGSQQSSTPVTKAQVDEIKAGMSLSEIEAKLGPSYPATSAQTARLNQMKERMPPHIRENASSGNDVAWGNNEGWLAGRMNEEGKVWMLSSQFGNGPPPDMARPAGMPQPPNRPAFRGPAPAND